MCRTIMMDMPVHDHVRVIDKLNPVDTDVVACRSGLVPVIGMTLKRDLDRIATGSVR